MRLEKLNEEQINILLDFAARCRHLCFGRPPSDREAQIIAYKEWKEFSRDMNYAYPGDEPSASWKSGLEWKQYFQELKVRTKAKVANAKKRSELTGTIVEPKLTDWEKQLIGLSKIAEREQKLRKNKKKKV